ncbi:hypothetical protein GCM10027074_44100 [Streptomyces deserti]
MSDDEARIRAQITRWAEAVHRGDRDGVLDDRAEDIAMYDAPPPHEGIRGPAAGRTRAPLVPARLSRCGVRHSVDALARGTGPV